ncbi:MAG: NHL repeat-containing protein [Pseudomonadota bacterium]
MSWKLIKEAGIGSAPMPAPGAGNLLQHPIFAQRAHDGSYLIVDELGKEKQVPFSFGCRTLRVDAAGAVLYDSLKNGIDDGFGCLLDDGSMAILRRTKWELLITSPTGDMSDCLYLDTLSKRLPRFVTWTCKGTFLVAFLNRAYDMDLVEIDRQGKLLWHLPVHVSHIGIASSIQLTEADTLLLADPIRHIGMELDRQGNLIWQFGVSKHPARTLDHLSSPGSIVQSKGGQRVIADTRNHRILLVDSDGTGCEILPHDGTLRDPQYASLFDDGSCLICDTGNARVIVLDRDGYIVWSYGSPVVPRRLLSYPRSVEVTESGAYLVADTAHDRIIELQAERITERPFHGNPGLFWPRCVRLLPSGSLLVADARNSRIVEVSATGRVMRQLAQIASHGLQGLDDPHDVRLLPDDRLLITDSGQDMVVVADWDGCIHLRIGGPGSDTLKDPHSAQQLEDGSIIIADTGHHRIVVVDACGREVREIRTLQGKDATLRLHHPRYVEVSPEGTMAIADTGHNRILAATLDGALIWELSRVPDSSTPLLNQPRWLKLIGRNEVVVCDHFHHRIVHVRNDAA